MKKWLLYISLPLLFITSAFEASYGIDEVISALRTGNASELGKYISGSIELSLPAKSDSYTKAGAVTALQEFFAANNVKGFEVKHQGDKGGSQFCIGILQTRNGNFRTTVFMKEMDGKQVIKEIRFQPEQ